MSKNLIRNITVNTDQASQLIETAISAKIVPLLKGSPGIGKSAIIHQIAKNHNLKVIDVRLSQADPTDLLGFPQINKDGTKAGYVPMETFPLEGDPIPDGYSGWLLFFDELTSAVPAIQASAYKIILDRQVGIHNLHPYVAIVAAGNLETDNAIVETMSTALQSRMIHFELRVDNKQWFDWAEKNHIDSRILAYLSYKPEMLYKFDPDHTDQTFPCPRTWEFTNRMLGKLNTLDESLLLPALAGTIGQGTAREFVGFTKIYQSLPKLETILANPDTTPIPDEISSKFALSGSIADLATKDNIDKLFTYLLRLPSEFQVLAFRIIYRRDSSIIPDKYLIEWADTLRDLSAPCELDKGAKKAA
ncbi:Uncharacterised protein [Oligella urethralis]|uniref:AAA family ATPase n=1 Tax=Oligella urethralis TaxID=90245 RepID=UPI000DFCC8D6|nr:AAA family ATPase [Oligella urethralis]SUA63396.1 Uncharacterised protein [Oligella urethralis]